MLIIVICDFLSNASMQEGTLSANLKVRVNC
jgi:hypothetical protein